MVLLWKIDERNLQTEELKPSNNSYFNPSQVVSTSVGVIFLLSDADGVRSYGVTLRMGA